MGEKNEAELKRAFFSIFLFFTILEMIVSQNFSKVWEELFIQNKSVWDFAIESIKRCLSIPDGFALQSLKRFKSILTTDVYRWMAVCRDQH